MALTGKDILNALGIDETFEAGFPASHSTCFVGLLQERILLDLRAAARVRETSIAEFTIEPHTLAGIIDHARIWERQNGLDTMEGGLGMKIREALSNVHFALENLLSQTTEA